MDVQPKKWLALLVLFQNSSNWTHPNTYAIMHLHSYDNQLIFKCLYSDMCVIVQTV